MRLTGMLVADGSSDRLLKPIIEWLLSQYLSPKTIIDIQVPDWGRLSSPDRLRTLSHRLAAARRFFEPDVYFVHRDTEKYGTWQERQQEIDESIQRVFRTDQPSYVRVVPVQMTETWLLHNEAAIREAAENPNGREPLTLPPVTRLEAMPEAKTRLLAILRTASGLTGRRLQKFEANERRRLHRLADLQQEQGFAVLRALPAFQQLEQEIKELADSLRA
jgi:hypothetical protein